MASQTHITEVSHRIIKNNMSERGFEIIACEFANCADGIDVDKIDDLLDLVRDYVDAII